MRTEYFTTASQARVTRQREVIEQAYDSLPETLGYWAMIDLVKSSNYRLTRGAKPGYIRGETFFSLVRDVVGRSSETRVIKEIGDAVLLSSLTFRPIFECVILVDQVAHQMAAIAGDGDYPFAIRSGIGFGNAKRIVRDNDDFLGAPIDRLARIMGVRSETSRILVDDEAYRVSAEVAAEYVSVLKFSESMMLSAEIAKNMARPVTYREVRMDRGALLEHTDLIKSVKTQA